MKKEYQGANGKKGEKKTLESATRENVQQKEEKDSWR